MLSSQKDEMLLGNIPVTERVLRQLYASPGKHDLSRLDTTDINPAIMEEIQEKMNETARNELVELLRKYKMCIEFTDYTEGARPYISIYVRDMYHITSVTGYNLTYETLG